LGPIAKAIRQSEPLLELPMKNPGQEEEARGGVDEEENRRGE